MSYTSNAPTVGLRSPTDAFFTPGNTRGTARLRPEILTYCYSSRMVYVTPGEDYNVCSFLPSQPDLRRRR